MNFLFQKKVAAIWLVIAPIVTFISGPGFIWEWRKTDVEIGRLEIDRMKASLEVREKMNGTLQEIIKLDPESPLRQRRVDDFNAAEKSLARIEGRSPVYYKLPATPGKPTLS